MCFVKQLSLWSVGSGSLCDYPPPPSEVGAHPGGVHPVAAVSLWLVNSCKCSRYIWKMPQKITTDIPGLQKKVAWHKMVVGGWGPGGGGGSEEMGGFLTVRA